MDTQPKHETLFGRIKNALKRKDEKKEDFTKGMPVFSPGRGPLQPGSSWEVMPPQPPKPKDEEKPRD
jgi:hypothetical protein